MVNNNAALAEMRVVGIELFGIVLLFVFTFPRPSSASIKPFFVRHAIIHLVSVL